MKTTYIYGMLAGAFAIVTAASCSDNYNAELEPVQKTLELKVDGHESAFSRTYNAAPGNYEVSVESNTLWRVEAVSDGGWISLDKVSGRGSESFTFSLRDNMLAERAGTVTVYMVNAEGEALGTPGSSIALTVRQDVSNVRLSPSSLEPFKPAGNDRTLFTVTANVPWTLDVSYDGDSPTEFISVFPESGDMQSAGDGAFSGDGEATFYISVADNRTSSNRKAYLNLRSEVDSYSVEITQSKSEYNFDVTPSENRVVPAQGGSVTFGVLSIVGWTVRSSAESADWLTFSLSSYPEGSDSRVEAVATVAPNPTGEERTAIVRFEPADSRYEGQSVTIIQRGQDVAFSVSRAEGPGIVAEDGERIVLDLDSRFEWRAVAPSWLGLSVEGGNASTSISRIEVTVAANASNDNRTGTVTITPLPTEFAGGVTLDPEALGIQPLHIGVTQFGGREAAVSVPWLRDGYTDRTATVEFNFYSPFHDVVEAGLEWGPADSGGRQTMTVTPPDPKDGTVSFELTGLTGATRYVARGYVKDSEGKVKYGDWTFPFTTAGRYPGAGDNPTPSR